MCMCDAFHNLGRDAMLSCAQECFLHFLRTSQGMADASAKELEEIWLAAPRAHPNEMRLCEFQW